MNALKPELPDVHVFTAGRIIVELSEQGDDWFEHAFDQMETNDGLETLVFYLELRYGKTIKDVELIRRIAGAMYKALRDQLEANELTRIASQQAA
jgi:hypothetical protein